MLDGGVLVADDPSSEAAGLPRLVIDRGPAPARRNRGASGEGPDLGLVRVGAATVVVRSEDAAVSALLAEAFALLPRAEGSDAVDAVVSVTDPGDGGPFEIHLDGDTIGSSPTVDGAADAVLTACNRVAASRPSGAVRIHGGAASRDGRSVVVCGPSGAGKSTTTAALVSRGWRYVTDEVVVIDPATLRITPYPKWIDLSSRSLELLGIDEGAGIGPTGAKHHVPPSLLGPVERGPSPVVTTIVLLTEDESGDPARRLAVRDSVPAMLGNVFATTWDDPDGLRALVDLCSRAVVVQLPRSDPTSMAERIDALLDTPADSVSP